MRSFHDPEGHHLVSHQVDSNPNDSRRDSLLFTDGEFGARQITYAPLGRLVELFLHDAPGIDESRSLPVPEHMKSQVTQPRPQSDQI